LLLVEDDADVREVVVDLLRDRGFEVLAAEDGAEALSVLDICRPDVILLDLTMPVLDGHGFLTVRATRPELAAIPVVLASAAPPPDDLAAGWNEFVTKPYQLDRLVAAIERCRAL
jgi:CheY-like chemotaxis protein